MNPFEITVNQGGANAVMVSWSFLGDKWTGESSNLMNTVLRDEWDSGEWRLQTSSETMVMDL